MAEFKLRRLEMRKDKPAIVELANIVEGDIEIFCRVEVDPNGKNPTEIVEAAKKIQMEKFRTLSD